MVDPTGGLRRDLHAPAGHHGREHGAAVDPEGPVGELHRPAVGDRRLRAHAGRAGPDRGLDRRPARPPVSLRRWSGDLLARLAALRARARPDLPQHLAGRAGHRRRRDVRRVAGPGRPGVPRRPGARDGDGRLRRHDRRRGGRRPAGRRPAHRRARLAVGLLPQRADRHRRDRRHLRQAARVARPQRDPGRLAGSGDLLQRPVPARARPGARQRRGLGQRPDRRRCSPARP